MDSDTTAMIAKEDRKQSEWHEIINARREIVSSWPRDRCQIGNPPIISTTAW